MECKPLLEETSVELLLTVPQTGRDLATGINIPMSKLVFYVPFNSQGHIGAWPQHWHLWESNLHTGDSLDLDAKLANHYATERLKYKCLLLLAECVCNVDNYCIDTDTII